MSGVRTGGALPRRSWPARFFGVIAELQTWKDLAYLVLAFPLGLFYFVFLIVGLSVGIALVIIWVGLPILAVTVLAWWAFAGFERWQASALLGLSIAGSRAPWEGDDSWWQRVKRHLGDARTWKDLAFLFVKFPLGIVSLVIVTVAVAVPAGFIGAPFYYRFVDSAIDDVRYVGVNLGDWRVDTLPEALVLVPIGILVLFVMLHLVNVFARFSGILAGALLDEGGPAPQPAAAAAPPPAAPTDATSPAAPAPGGSVGATSPVPSGSPASPAAPLDATPPAGPASPDSRAPASFGPSPQVAPGTPPPPVAPGTPPPPSPEPPAQPQSGAPEATH